MSTTSEPDTEELIERAGRDDATAFSSCWSSIATGCGRWWR